MLVCRATAAHQTDAMLNTELRECCDKVLGDVTAVRDTLGLLRQALEAQGIQVKPPASQPCSLQAVPSGTDHVKPVSQELHAAHLSSGARHSTSREATGGYVPASVNTVDEASNATHVQLDVSQDAASPQPEDSAPRGQSNLGSRQVNSSQHTLPSQHPCMQPSQAVHTDELNAAAAGSTTPKPDCQHQRDCEQQAAALHNNRFRPSERAAQPNIAAAHDAMPPPRAQNAKHSTSSSNPGYKQKLHGVRPMHGEWQSRLKRNGLREHVGMFRTEYAAGRAYDRALLVSRGSADVLNTIDIMNFPLHDYLSDNNKAVRAAASLVMTQLAVSPKHSPGSRKRKRSSTDTQKSPLTPERRATTDKPSAAAAGHQLDEQTQPSKPEYSSGKHATAADRLPKVLHTDCQQHPQQQQQPSSSPASLPDLTAVGEQLDATSSQPPSATSAPDLLPNPAVQAAPDLGPLHATSAQPPGTAASGRHLHNSAQVPGLDPQATAAPQQADHAAQATAAAPATATAPPASAAPPPAAAAAVLCQPAAPQQPVGSSNPSAPPVQSASTGTPTPTPLNESVADRNQHQRLSHLHTPPGTVETVLATESDNDVEIMSCSPEPEQAPAADAAAPAPQQHQPSKASQHPQAPQRQAQAEAAKYAAFQAAVLCHLPVGMSASHPPATLPSGLSQVKPHLAAAIKQEATRPVRSNGSANTSQQHAVQAGSSSAHPVELSDSDSEGQPKRSQKSRKRSHSSSTSSSMHADDKASLRHLHADTAASHGQSHDPQTFRMSPAKPQLSNKQPHAEQHAQQQQQQQQMPRLHMPAKASDAHSQQLPRQVPQLDPRLRLRTQVWRQQPERPVQQPGHALHRQQVKQEQQAQQQHAPVAGKPVTSGLHQVPLAAQRQAGSSAEQAQVVSDDEADNDDDVIIIEAGMQPHAAAPVATPPAAQLHPPDEVLHKPEALSHVILSQPQQADAKPQPSAAGLTENVGPDPQPGPQHSIPSSSQDTAVVQQQSHTRSEGDARGTTPVAEMLRMERWSDVDFQAAQAAEMEQRQAVIRQQQGEAQREKKHRREAQLRIVALAKQQQVRVERHRAEQASRDAQAQEKEQLRPHIRRNLTLRIGHSKPTLYNALRAFNIFIDGGNLASDKQIEKAYRKATVLFHPDKHVNSEVTRQVEAEETFKILSEAAARPRKR